MNPGDVPHFGGGMFNEPGKQNELADQSGRALGMKVAPPLVLENGPIGLLLRIMDEPADAAALMFAQLNEQASDGSNRYAWTEWQANGDGTVGSKPGGASGAMPDTFCVPVFRVDVGALGVIHSANDENEFWPLSFHKFFGGAVPTTTVGTGPVVETDYLGTLCGVGGDGKLPPGTYQITLMLNGNASPSSGGAVLTTQPSGLVGSGTWYGPGWMNVVSVPGSGTGYGSPTLVYYFVATTRWNVKFSFLYTATGGSGSVSGYVLAAMI